MPDIVWDSSTLDWRVALFTGIVALLSGLVAGFVPAIQASRPRLAQALKSGGRDGSRHRSRLRTGLVMVQTALSVMLLAGAVLFVQSLRNVRALDIGFEADRLIFGRLEFLEGETPPGPVVVAMMREAAARLTNRPGVEAVARVGMEPMRGSAGRPSLPMRSPPNHCRPNPSAPDRTSVRFGSPPPRSTSQPPAFACSGAARWPAAIPITPPPKW